MKSSAVLRADLESAFGNRFAAQLTWRERPAPERVPAGIEELDAITGGLPRGSITEIHGPASSGRSSLLASILAAATARQEVCALADASDAFDPASAEAAGVDLSKLLWIRCGGNPEHALKAADMLIQAGGFGLVALELGDVPAEVARRIPLASWYRFRRAIENTPAVMVVVEREHTVKSCASMTIEMRRERLVWSGAPGCSQLLRSARFGAVLPDARPRRKPSASERASFEVEALG
jgi:recombination protein RecA